jgi:hypothetical protein
MALKNFIRKACFILDTHIQEGVEPTVGIKKKVEFSDTGLSVSEVFIPTYDGLIFKYADEIQEQEEIDALVEARLNSDTFPRPNISRSDGKPLVDDDYVYSIKWAGVQFLFTYVRKNNGVQFNETLFDSMYRDYEYFNVTQKTTFSVVCPLYNYNTDVDVLQLDDIVIRKITENEYEQIYFDDIFGSRPDFTMISGHRYVISTVYESDKHREISNEIYEKILSLLTVLRLFKPGNLQYGTIRNLPLSWTSGYSPIIGGTRLQPSRGMQYNLTREEIDSFRMFVKKYNSSLEKTHLDIATSRLNFTYDRTRNEDKIIDIIVGFESLFVGEKERPSNRGSYVGTACSMLIGKTHNERKKIKKLLIKAFDIRNKIVHGSKYKTDDLNKMIPEIEMLLRNVINRLL